MHWLSLQGTFFQSLFDKWKSHHYALEFSVQHAKISESGIDLRDEYRAFKMLSEGRERCAKLELLRAKNTACKRLARNC